ncbi:MAG: tRNA lysidine(34) synthetase TilS [Propionibacteriaceae bacterium]|jgi:tRNA(Ile)-lysidine synthase|nr:tRNA lysidine(34) synthetase TilS [Propionibacteriaceae bacterium]
MARQALTPSCLALVKALETHVPPALEALGLTSCRIGLSGGADSLALTAAAAWVRDRRAGPLAGMDVTARIIDHELQHGSHLVAERARTQSEGLGVSAEIIRVKVNSTHGGLEAGARAARYEALTWGDGALVLLGHTLDDQAETVLLGLGRGSGTRSLSGMPRSRDHLLRPLLDLRRFDTEQACKDWGLSWWDDPMNEDPSFSRTRVRQAMVTLEAALGPGLTQSLARTAQLCRTDADYLDLLAFTTGIDTQAREISVDALAVLDPALRHRILLAWLRGCGNDAVTRDHVLAVDALVTNWHGQKEICVPVGSVVRTKGVIQLLN